jgi:Family of unknown function (DUF5906)
MTEAAKLLNAEKAIQQIHSHIAAYLDGGPDRKDEDIDLARNAGLKVEAVSARWEDAHKTVKVSLPPLEIVVLPPERPAKAEAPTVSVASWRRDRKPKPEASFFGPSIQPSIEVTPTTTSPSPEPKPAPTPEPKEEEEPRVMLPAVVPTPPLPAKWDDAIEAMNNRHAIIDNVGSKTVIAGWEPSPLDPTKLVVVFQNKESFLLRYSNRYASVDVTDGKSGSQQRSVALGNWWLCHRQRRQHRGITFLPDGPKVINQCLNLWQGWGVEPKAGDWSLIREHIELVLASGNEEFADYIIRWIAWAIQNPAAQAEVALVLIGAKGVGKGTLVRCLQRIFGAHAFQVTSREHVIDKFNGHLQDCVLFIADEAYWGGDKRCVGRLQGMITEPTLPIERKGLDVFEVRNFLHIVMLAEPGWVIPVGRYERRYAAVAVSTAKRGDKAYFRSLHQQIEDGGVGAMFYDLRMMDLGDWHPRDIPEALLTNPALQKQQSHTLPPLEQWYVMLLHNGKLPGALANRPGTAFTRSLIDDARAKVPRLRDLTEVSLRNFLLDEESIGTTCTKYRASIGNGWTFPPLAEAREAWSRRYGPVKWDTPDLVDWSKKEG